MSQVELRGYWPVLEVVRTDRPPALRPVRRAPESVADWMADAHAPWPRLLRHMCSPAETRSTAYAAADELITHVSRHAFASIGVLYPALAPALEPYDADLVSTLTADLVAAAHVMVRLEHLMHGDTHQRASAFPAYCVDLRELLHRHAMREESLLPIVGLLDEGRRRRMLAALAAAERRAPTRPHPHTLAHHAAIRLAGRLEHVIDVVRDTLDNRLPAA